MAKGPLANASCNHHVRELRYVRMGLFAIGDMHCRHDSAEKGRQLLHPRLQGRRVSDEKKVLWRCDALQLLTQFEETSTCMVSPTPQRPGSALQADRHGKAG
jgi:hypothetical protein